MLTRAKSQTRLLFIGSLIITLIFIYISTTWLFPTLSKYIKREQDEIRAYYTALHFATTGEGKTIALENGVGYIDFDLRNYVGENVTERDIVYTISKPTTFYDSLGNPIPEEELEEHVNGGKGIYVLDVWKTPQRVKDETYLYDVEIVRNNGEVVSEGVYEFTYEKLAVGAKGKIHNLTCKITARDKNRDLSNDQISIVVKLQKPYEEVLIINMNISNRLITFAHKNIEVFSVPLDKVYMQTADLFAYTKNEDEEKFNDVERKIEVGPNKYYLYTPYAMKLTLYWTGYMLDEIELEEIYTGTTFSPGSIKDYDTVDNKGTDNHIGTIPNPNLYDPYIDLKQARIARLNSLNDNTYGHRGEMVLFMPQGSDIYFHFLKKGDVGHIYVKIELYVDYYENDVKVKSGYEIYSEDIFGGYNHERVNGEDYYNLASYVNPKN